MSTDDTLGFIRQNQQTYSDSYESMNWLTPEKATAAAHTREALIDSIFAHEGAGPGWRFAETKLFTHDISPGCDLCGKGDWSCLFINGICNARCFYCPSSQKEKGQPMTSSVEFSNPNEYAKYINTFNIKAVSFSGGEPFMTFDRVLVFLKTLREKVSHPLYIWMYTNGLLVTEEKLVRLKDGGLDEIRFDLSANRYQLDAVTKAVGIIPHVTVEIPAIPEDLEITKQVIRKLHGLGINYLNLHQLRCTPFNKNAFMERGYTFVHGPGVTILETELTALKLILFALDEDIRLPINYCSFTYRNQFQAAGARKRTAPMIKAAHEDVTATGRIRTMSLCAGEKEINTIHDYLISCQMDTCLWKRSKAGDELFFSGELWPYLDFSKVRLKVAYSTTTLKSKVSYRHAFKEVSLGRKKKVVMERYVKQAGVFLEGDQIHEFGNRFVLAQSGLSTKLTEPFSCDLLDDMCAYERFTPGLAHYF